MSPSRPSGSLEAMDTDVWTERRCLALDAADPLGPLRDRFIIPDGLCYLDGNSLGCLPRAVPERIERVVEQEWAQDLVGGWDEWMSLPERVGDRLARLVGAGPGEVIVLDTTTIALLKLLGAARRLRPDRGVILTTAANFPTDLYAIDASAALFGCSVRRVSAAELGEALDDTVAVLCLTHVDFRTGSMLDMSGLSERARAVGALTIWDLSHSAGALPVDLDGDGVDLAVRCTYKYLNAGPGSPAFIYVRAALQDQVTNALPGWLGHEAPFAFAASYRPAPGIRRFVTSSPSVIGISAVDAALDAWDGVELVDVRAKSVALTEMFIEAVAERTGAELELASPRDPSRRGSQVSLRHERAYEVVQALIARGVIGDFRSPDLCRFGFAPLYLRYVDVLRAVEHLADVLRSREYLEARFAERRTLT